MHPLIPQQLVTHRVNDTIATTADLRRARKGTLPVWLPAALVLAGSGWGSNQFTPLLVVYQRTLSLSTGTVEAMFGAYALGLIPGLLIAGPMSDARGRRRPVTLAAAVSLAASIALIAGGQAVALLFVGRLLAGLSSGAAFGAGTAWVRELSLPPYGEAADHAVARRAAVAMTCGFALGPLIAGTLAQWAPYPMLTPYVPHLVLMSVVLVMVGGAPETVMIPGRGSLRARPRPRVNRSRFLRVVAPRAPWVFAAPAVAFALLPSVVGADHAADGIALVAAITAFCALAGVFAQPLARRLDALRHANLASTVGLSVLVCGLLLSALCAQERSLWLLVPCAAVLGVAYGLCLVAGLVEVPHLAGPGDLAQLTSIYYAFTYVGFAAPFALALGAHFTGYPVLLSGTAVLALLTAIATPTRSAR